MTQNNIIHTCQIHGPLTKEQVYTNKKLIKANGSYHTMCKACMKERNRQQANKQIAILSDTYIKRLLTQHSRGTIKTGSIPSELIELKRAQIELKRLQIKKEREELEQWIREQFLNSNSKL